MKEKEMSKKKMILFTLGILAVIAYFIFLYHSITTTFEVEIKNNSDFEENIIIDDTDVIDNISYNIPPVIKVK